VDPLNSKNFSAGNNLHDAKQLLDKTLTAEKDSLRTSDQYGELPKLEKIGEGTGSLQTLESSFSSSSPFVLIPLTTQPGTYGVVYKAAT